MQKILHFSKELSVINDELAMYCSKGACVLEDVQAEGQELIYECKTGLKKITQQLFT